VTYGLKRTLQAASDGRAATRPRFRAVLFDNGGTLFQRSPAPEAIVRLAAERGIEITLDDARSRWRELKVGKSKTPAARLARNRSSEAHRTSYLAWYQPLDEICDGLAEAMYLHYKTSPDTMIPYADTPGTLQRLHDCGVATGVVSNTGWNIREGYLRAGLDHLIDVFILSHEHGAAKPDSTLIRLACDDLGVDPAVTLMVGNDGPADGGAAAGIGCPCLILPPARVGSVRGLDHVLALAGLSDGTEDSATLTV
jgi:HAD superfamily hydrolase (TIGR01549 family)